MPLLSNAQKLYVGSTSIKRVFSNGFLVWPKSCTYTAGRPNPLPPANNGPSVACSNHYYTEFGTIKVGWSKWGNDGRYSGFQCDLFDTNSCAWVKQGVTPTDVYIDFSIDKSYLIDFQTYDARVTGVFASNGLPDESMWRYPNSRDNTYTYATVPSRAPSAPFRVNAYPNIPSPGSVYVQWADSTAVPTYSIAGYKIEIKLTKSEKWEFLRETIGPDNSLYLTAADGITIGQRYTLRVAGLTSICLSQSNFTESDPFLFT